MPRDNRRFRRGSGVYTCTSCGKQTRETGEGESRLDLCRACMHEAGLENEHMDGFHKDGLVEGCPLCKES